MLQEKLKKLQAQVPSAQRGGNALSKKLEDAIGSFGVAVSKEDIQARLLSFEEKMKATIAESIGLAFAQHSFTDDIARLDVLVNQLLGRPVDEAMRLIGEGRYDDAFNFTLNQHDSAVVVSLCEETDLLHILATTVLDQRVMLQLFHCLGQGVTKGFTTNKMYWLIRLAALINPAQPSVKDEFEAIFQEIQQIINCDVCKSNPHYPALSCILKGQLLSYAFHYKLSRTTFA